MLRSILFAFLTLGWLMPVQPGDTSKAQTAKLESATGVVANDEHSPLTGVPVYSSPTCCPVSAAHALTDAAGRYTLEKPGSIVHVRHPGFQPVTKLSSQPRLDFTLQPAENSLQLSVCAAPPSTSAFGGIIRFTPPGSAQVPPNTGTEFAAYSIPSEASSSYLRIWLGSRAGSMDAAESLYLKSVSFRERFVVDERGKVIGMDTSGITPEGKRWRWVGFNPSLDGAWPNLQDTAVSVVALGMARYEDATEEDSRFFDGIIDSACLPVAGSAR